jgi:hypothetical protein
VGLDVELGAEGKIEVGGLGDDAEKFLFRKIVLFFWEGYGVTGYLYFSV